MIVSITKSMYLLECSIAISYHVITKAYAWLIHWSGSCSFRNRAKRVVVSVRERNAHQYTERNKCER